jgi:hypothetical protein
MTHTEIKSHRDSLATGTAQINPKHQFTGNSLRHLASKQMKENCSSPVFGPLSGGGSDTGGAAAARAAFPARFR